MMKKTIKNIVTGSLLSLALMTGTSFADETKLKDLPQENTLIKDFILSLKNRLKEDGMSDTKIEAILKDLETGKVDSTRKNRTVITRTMIIGPGGKLQEATNETEHDSNLPIDLSNLLSESKDGEVKKLLKENKNPITSGKVVIIDSSGKRIEKELKQGGDFNEMLQGTLEDMKFNIRITKPELPKNDHPKDLAAKVDQLQKELTAQRLLLEKILQKLN